MYMPFPHIAQSSYQVVVVSHFHAVYVAAKPRVAIDRGK